MTFNVLRKYQQIYLHDCKENTGTQMDNNQCKKFNSSSDQSYMLFKLNLRGCNLQRVFFMPVFVLINGIKIWKKNLCKTKCEEKKDVRKS